MTLSVTAIVLTFNEESNLPACLESLRGWRQKTFVVDSGSTDRTVTLAQEAGAEVVRHPFETHAKQWNWALKNIPIQTDWVLCLYADYRISVELRATLCRILPKTPSEVTGYYIPRKQIFRGRWIRHGTYWPRYILTLFRRDSAWSDERELVDCRFSVEGKTVHLKQPIVEQNEKERSVLFWLQKHLTYIELQAQEEYLRRHHRLGWKIRPSLWGTPDQKVLWWKRIWYRMPLLVRPFLYYGYRYVIRLGFLDGSQGALFHFLQGFWLRLMVDVRIRELERGHGDSRD